LPKKTFDLITFIPLHRRRQNWRGFNQAEKLAEKLGSLTRIPLTSTLARTKYTRPLVGAESVKERRKEINQAFNLLPGVDLKDKRLVLVDDVYTSGATMLEAARVLKLAGARSVWSWTLAG
jgi:ComF family protein